MNRVLFAAALALAGCTTAPEIEPAPDLAPQPAEESPITHCADYTLDHCDPPFAVAMRVCQELYGEQWNELVSPMECPWGAAPPAAWDCEPTEIKIVCPGAEEYPSFLYCCNW